MNDIVLMQQVVELARQAGKAILPFWRADVAVTAKADESPVTAADLAAHEVIAQGLRALAPQIPVLSEEGCDIPLSERQGWQRWWLVDPLDGTKEFLAGTEEFTVNIALIEEGRVVFGVVVIPTNGICYFGGRGIGAWRSELFFDSTIITVRLAPSSGEKFTVVASRRHTSQQQEKLLAELEKFVGGVELINIGSSLKFCLLAEGRADFYPRLAPTSQWDTAAAQGVLEGAGGRVLDLNGDALVYSAGCSYINPSFVAVPMSGGWVSIVLEEIKRVIAC